MERSDVCPVHDEVVTRWPFECRFTFAVPEGTVIVRTVGHEEPRATPGRKS
jgi:hypothetical protein